MAKSIVWCPPLGSTHNQLLPGLELVGLEIIQRLYFFNRQALEFPGNVRKGISGLYNIQCSVCRWNRRRRRIGYRSSHFHRGENPDVENASGMDQIRRQIIPIFDIVNPDMVMLCNGPESIAWPYLVGDHFATIRAAEDRGRRQVKLLLAQF